MVSNDVEKRLWAVADQLWANTGLRPADFSVPVLGLIFLRYAESKFAEAEERIGPVGSGKRRKIGKSDYQAEGVIFLTPKARFSYLQSLSEGDDIGKVLNDAMKAIEEENQDLRGALPQTYNVIENSVLIELLRLLGPVELSGDAFGKVYEYFLGNFAMKEGQKGGVFYTPDSIVKLIVEIIEPYHGRIYDPACGSGGMFVHSAGFVERHHKSAGAELSIYGVEKDSTTVNLNKMNLAVHGLSGDIREANSFYDDPHKQNGRFDFVMANPPFNVSGVDKERLAGDRRFPFGVPTTDNANYLWIQMFYSALNDSGRAGFVMADSAADSRGSDKEVRKHLIESGHVEAVVSIATKFFYTVGQSCMLWFINRNPDYEQSSSPSVLFIDARRTFRQIDRAHREFLPEHIEYLANIVRLRRGEEVEAGEESLSLLKKDFPNLKYRDVPGTCSLTKLGEIEGNGWSLNPARYVELPSVESNSVGDVWADFESLQEDLELLNDQAEQLKSNIRNHRRQGGGSEIA